jgi:hypothetical protein
VVAALLAIGTGTAVPTIALGAPGLGASGLGASGLGASALAAAAYAVPARVERLVRPRRPVSAAAGGLTLAVVLAFLAAAPVLLTAITG